MSTQNAKLLPCPFCGGEATLESVHLDGKLRWSVGCNEAEGLVALCFGFQSLTTFVRQSEAVAAWNRRAKL